MNLLSEKLRARGHHCPQFGGSSSSASRSDTTTNNTDNRQAVQDGIGLSNANGNTVSYNSTDAVKAVANLGADVIKTTGGAIVELNRDSVQANATAWDATVKTSAALVDRLIDASTDLGTAALKSYEPTENKNADVLKWAALAGAAVLALQLIKK